TAPTGAKPTEKRPRKPRPPHADNESGAPRAAEQAEKAEKPATPAGQEGRYAKPRTDTPRRERQPKPVAHWQLEDSLVEPQEG
ncbi:ATP-dependent RNA helicase RhlB, partial [Pseudomonas aeruginosa]